MSTLRLSLGVALSTALIMLTRAVIALPEGGYLYVRPWCTVIASLALLGGGIGALRGRTWGVLLCGAAGTAFLGAWVVGIAPAYFAGVGAVGLLPTACVAHPLFRFDRRAALAAVALAFVLGGSAAVAAGPVLDALR